MDVPAERLAVHPALVLVAVEHRLDVRVLDVEVQVVQRLRQLTDVQQPVEVHLRVDDLNHFKLLVAQLLTDHYHLLSDVRTIDLQQAEELYY